jgi:predicted RNase H-like HicB family nuclease
MRLIAVLCESGRSQHRWPPSGTLGYDGEQMRQAVVFKGEDGQWVAECLSLPGCVSQGQTPEEAVSQLRDAIRLYISVLEEDHLPIPEERFDTLLVAV